MKKFKIITIPFNAKTELFNEDELNKFIFNKNVKNYQVHFFQTQAKSYWTVFLEYEPLIEQSKKESAGLNESDKMFFEKLRVWRKENAEKAGVPVYVISTNKQLLDIVQQKPQTLEALKRINGFGKKKIEQYGKQIIEMVRLFYGQEQNK